MQKLAELLQKGEDAQILFALGELAQLLENCLHDTLALFVPSVCEFAPRWSTEVQLRAGRELLGISEEKLPSEVGRCMALASVLVIRTIDNSNIPVAADMYDVWGRLASKSVAVTAWQAKDLSSILRFVDRSAKSPFSEERRAAVGFCQGMCKCRAPNLDVRRQGFSRLWTFALDPSSDVLAKCLEVMGDCAEEFTDSIVSERVWPLVQRAWMEDPKSVASPKGLLARAAAVKCASQLCEARFGINTEGQSRETAQDTAAVHELLVRVLSFAEVWSVKDQRELDQELYIAEIAVAEHLVKLIYFAAKGVTESRSSFSMRKAASVYSQLVQANGPGIREKCAFNMPAMAQLVEKDKAAVAMLTTCCNELAFDSEECVRETFAKGLHETLNGLLLKGSAEKLYGTVLDLLQDESLAVRNGVIAHISECLITLANVAGGKGIDKKQIVDAMEKTSLALSKRSWRLSKIFSQQVTSLCAAFPALGLEQLVIPILFEIVSATGSCEVRSEAAKSIVTISRTVPEEALRDKYVGQLLQSLSDGPYKTRISVIDCGVHALSVYSEVLFSQLFAAPLLRLCTDKVPNVRICVAKALPQLAPWCQAHELFEPALAQLRGDPDKDVRDVMQSFVLRASEYVSKSKDEEETVYSRRVEEVLYYSSTSARLSPNGGLGAHVTPKSIPTKMKKAVQQSRIVKRIGEIASLRSQDTNHDELARAYSLTETHGREDLVSISGPLPTSHAISSISWASEERSTDAYFLRNEDGRACPATARTPPAHVKPNEIEGQDEERAPQSVLDFSAVLSGNLSSFGLTADLPNEGQTSQAGPAISRGSSRGQSSDRGSSRGGRDTAEYKPRLNASAQALPVQALVKKFSNRRSRQIPKNQEQPLVTTFSADSAFSTMSSAEGPDQFEQASSEQTAQAHTRHGEEEVRAQTDEESEPPKSLFRRLTSIFGFGRTKPASPSEVRSASQQQNAEQAPAAAEPETANATRHDTLSVADPPQLPEAPAPRTTASARAIASPKAKTSGLEEEVDILPAVRAPPPLPDAAVDSVDAKTAAHAESHSAGASRAAARARSGVRSSSGSSSESSSGPGSGRTEYDTAMQIPVPAATAQVANPPPSVETPPASRGTKTAALLAPLRRKKTADGMLGSGSGSGSGPALRQLRSDEGSPRAGGRLKIAGLGAGLGAGLRLLGRRRSSSEAADAGAASGAGGEDGVESEERRSESEESAEQLPVYCGTPPWALAQLVEQRREEAAEEATRASAAERDRATVVAAEHGKAPVSSLTALWERIEA